MISVYLVRVVLLELPVIISTDFFVENICFIIFMDGVLYSVLKICIFGKICILGKICIFDNLGFKIIETQIISCPYRNTLNEIIS